MRRLAAGALLALALGACGGSASVSTRTRSPQTTPSGTTESTVAAQPPPAPQPKPKAKPKPKPRPRPSPGSLPQTDQLPSAVTSGFHTEMAALWAGVRTNSLSKAMPAFFPEGAYVQVKAIGDAQGDYTGRLVADYRLDLAAAHTLLGAHPASADLVGVRLPPTSVHWVPPNACYNRVGYYEWPNARLVYRENGSVHSFGIASMISWRGVWYVVHLGAILRPAAGGVVDDPSPGVGVSAPSSTC